MNNSWLQNSWSQKYPLPDFHRGKNLWWLSQNRSGKTRLFSDPSPALPPLQGRGGCRQLFPERSLNGKQAARIVALSLSILKKLRKIKHRNSGNRRVASRVFQYHATAKGESLRLDPKLCFLSLGHLCLPSTLTTMQRRPCSPK